MLKKTITYTDYNGVSRTEDFYFNLSKAELMTLEMSVKGGWTESVKKIVSSPDQQAIFQLVREIFLRSYGEKSEDGKRFIKSPELAEAFSQTEAYSQLFLELMQDADKLTNFISGIIPADLSAEVKKEIAKAEAKEKNIEILPDPSAAESTE